MKGLVSTLKGLRNIFSQSVDELINKAYTENKPKLPLTTKDHIRISSIPYLCPREEALAKLHNVTRTVKWNKKEMLTFDFGNAFQDIVRDKVFMQDGTLVGNWYCKDCGHAHGAVDGVYWLNKQGVKETNLEKRISKPAVCNTKIEGYGVCTGTDFEYIEEYVKHDLFRLTGHLDGILWNARYNHVLEIKTANNWRYKQACRAPFPEHLEQAMTYCWLTNRQKVLIFYFNKDTGDYKVWDLPFDMEIVNRVINRARITWDAIKEIEKTGECKELPMRICQSSTDSKAKECELSKQCFSCF